MSRTAQPLAIGDLSACCSPRTGGVISTETAERLAAACKALADPARVKLLSLIAASKNGEACICDLTAPLGLSQPTVSHHMKQLADGGLVNREQRGKWAYYRVETDALTRLGVAIATNWTSDSR
ncbi:ArsR/SmtB family transcription factor [Mycolicibacterium canariasense]|uniref:ArsR/SmtB family transcription factor n=1 Tax=Mycolicibacterium canariasense TaxID=228230 RepID=UPI000A037771|nr:metalloregulator ArsR/SmtB family transcription factor [Mycolicibacterium canariasense]